MIKINKPLDQFSIPVSLREPVAANFEDGQVDPKATLTHNKRAELDAANKYINKESFNDRYKLDDVKEALDAIYHRKCAYCEQWIEQFHVEHYRPKNTYYWLAFSWDNLLVSCPTCNQNKGASFSIQSAIPATKDVNIDINLQSDVHDLVERPLLVNPEVIDPIAIIEFDKKGKVFSADARLAHTIQICELDRKSLNDKRKQIWDELVSNIRAESLNRNEEGYAKIQALVDAFVRHATPELPFTAFRQYAIAHWLHR